MPMCTKKDKHSTDGNLSTAETHHKEKVPYRCKVKRQMPFVDIVIIIIIGIVNIIATTKSFASNPALESAS